MFSKGYYVTAELAVKASVSIDEAYHHLTRLCEATLKEPGCTIFTLHRCANNEPRFLLWERFDSEQDFKFHFEQPHTQAYLKRDLTQVVQFFVSDVC